MAKKSSKPPTPAKKRSKAPQGLAAVADATTPLGPERAAVEGGEAQGATAEAAGAPAAAVEGAGGEAPAAGAVAQTPEAPEQGPAAEDAPDPTPASVPAPSGVGEDHATVAAARPNGRGKGRAAKAGPADAAVQPGKRSALDAAAQVLAEAGAAMTCQEMIGAMAAKGYWTSPGGKTPAATLYSAILMETRTKGPQSRFTKTERGQFGLAARG